MLELLLIMKYPCVVVRATFLCSHLQVKMSLKSGKNKGLLLFGLVGNGLMEPLRSLSPPPPILLSR